MVAKNARRDEKRRIKTLQGFDKKVRTAPCASNRSPLRLEPARWKQGRLSRAPPPGLALRSAISWRGSASARRRKRMRTRMRMRTESHIDHVEEPRRGCDVEPQAASAWVVVRVARGKTPFLCAETRV